MAEHGSHRRTFAVGQLSAEGQALRAGPEGHEWLHTERGQERIERVLTTETETTRFALA